MKALEQLGITGMFGFLGPHDFSIRLVIPHLISQKRVDENVRLMHMTHHTLTGRNGARQFVANGMTAIVTDAERGATTQIGVPAVLDRTPGAIQSGQPRVGEHSRDVLSGAGYSEAEIDGLVQRGVVGEGALWGR